MNKVVITGMGAITPLGSTVEGFWENAVSGKNGIRAIDLYDASSSRVKLAAQAEGFSPEDYFDRKEAKRMDRFCQFAVAAAVMAARDAGLTEAPDDPWRSGVIVGSGIGGINVLEDEQKKLLEKGEGRVSPFLVPTMIGNMGAGMIAIRLGFKGVNFCPVTACATGTHAIGEAFRLIRHGYLDRAAAGGAEASITPLVVAGFANMTALSLSEDKDAASLPFDRRRGGFVMGEGAGILVLESEQSARARGAKIYAELAGYGATADAYHITSPDPEGTGAARAMTDAISQAGALPEQVDYINAHGTGTPLNDKYETLAIKAALGAHAYKTSVSSTKSMTGHLLGAAGAAEAILTALAVQRGIAPPTINCLEPDPELDLDYTINGAVQKQISLALSNSLGFGGHNATLAFRRWEG